MPVAPHHGREQSMVEGTPRLEPPHFSESTWFDTLCQSTELFFCHYSLQSEFVVQSKQRNQQVPTVENVVSSILGNRSTFFRYAFILPVIGGLLFCGLGYLMGRTHLRLLFKGARAQGTIVDYRAESFTIKRSGETNSTSTRYMPVIEYRAFGDKKVRFQDWLGSSIAGNRNQVVQVLYDPTNPSVAMIDRPIWNWIPWAPTIAVGLLLIMSGVRSGLQSLLRTSC